MTAREKLIEILSTKIHPREGVDPAAVVADFLLDHGVLPVVRCLDCKYFQHYGRTSLFIDGKHVKAGWCTRRILCDEEYRMLPDGFCSCGRRKEDTP